MFLAVPGDRGFFLLLFFPQQLFFAYVLGEAFLPSPRSHGSTQFTSLTQWLNAFTSEEKRGREASRALSPSAICYLLPSCVREETPPVSFPAPNLSWERPVEGHEEELATETAFLVSRAPSCSKLTC